MIDHRIILNILYHTGPDRTALIEETKRECSADSAFIFFPFYNENYYRWLNGLNPKQYLLRLRMLYSLLWRTN
jgi:hypothetical protein